MKKTLSFLRKIKVNNNTDWMKANKEDYLEARKEFEFLVQEVIGRLSRWDDRFSFLEPRDSIFRLNRDIRFSDNKNPYKENFAAFFGIGGKKSSLPGYFISVSPKEIFLAAGLWQPEADKLLKVRRYISDQGEQLQRIETQKSFKKTFGGLDHEDTLKRVPKGFDRDHPFGAYLKLRSFIASKGLLPKDALEKDFGKNIDRIFRDLQPLNDFLHKALTHD